MSKKINIELFKMGFTDSINPKEKKSLKQFAREQIENAPDEKKIELLNAMDPETVWEMAEGKPHATNEVTGKEGKDLFTGLSDEDKKILDALRVAR